MASSVSDPEKLTAAAPSAQPNLRVHAQMDDPSPETGKQRELLLRNVIVWDKANNKIDVPLL